MTIFVATRNERSDSAEGPLIFEVMALERTRRALEAIASRAIRAKLGEGIRSRYNLAQSLPKRLHQLLKELRDRADHRTDKAVPENDRETTSSRLRSFPSRFP
jgi:hypothetical protein